MIAVRWPDGKVKCPHCGSEDVTYLQKARVYNCNTKHPKQKFSLKVGTVFEDSPIPLEKWLPAMWMMVTCKNGISSYEVHRALGRYPEVRLVHAASYSCRHEHWRLWEHSPSWAERMLGRSK